jgi:hypothetical protein
MSDKKIKEKQAKLITQLAEICEELNWLIVIPQEEMTSGLIIGNKEYVDYAANKVYGSRYEIINPKANPKAPVATSPIKEETLIVELSEEEYEEFLETGELPDTVNVPDKPTYH